MSPEDLMNVYRPNRLKWDYLSANLFRAAQYHGAKAMLILANGKKSFLETSDGLYHEGACVEMWIKAAVSLESPALLFDDSNGREFSKEFSELERVAADQEVPETMKTKSASKLLDFFYRNNSNEEQERASRLARKLLSYRNSAVHMALGPDCGYVNGSAIALWIRITLMSANFDQRQIDNFFAEVPGLDVSDAKKLNRIWKEKYSSEKSDLLSKLLECREEADKFSNLDKNKADKRLKNAQEKTKRIVLSFIDEKPQSLLEKVREGKGTFEEKMIADSGIAMYAHCPCCGKNNCALFFQDMENLVKITDTTYRSLPIGFECLFCGLTLTEDEEDLLSSIPIEDLKGYWDRANVNSSPALSLQQVRVPSDGEKEIWQINSISKSEESE